MRFATLAVVATAALVGSTLAAFATDDTGTIASIDYSQGTITLDNGNIYIVPPYIAQQNPLSIGEKVKVTYQDMIVSAVAKAT